MGELSDISGLGSGGNLSATARAYIGRTLDERFEILRPIGQGAMGTVFLARQLSVDRLVAVKVLREDLSPVSTARFMREARIISAIRHPNIVHLIDFAHHPGEQLLYFAMEYVEGPRLSQVNKLGRLDPNLVIELCAQICSALAETHARGVVHRDLKPSNMLVVVAADGSPQLKVLDFGVAHTFEGMDKLTGTGLLCGTPAYMAPEQASGAEMGEAVDLYALGINLHEMLAGSRPFTGGTPIEVAVKQVQAPPPSLRAFVDAGLLPMPLVALCEELLAKDPKARPRSAVDVRGRLLQIRAELGWGPILGDVAHENIWASWAMPPLDEANLGGAVRAAGKGSAGSDILKPSIPAEGLASSTTSLPERQGGGWDAFNVTPSEAAQQEYAVPTDVSTFDGASTGDESATQSVVDVGRILADRRPDEAEEAPKSKPGKPAKPKPAPPVTKPSPERAEIEAPQRRGTTVHDMPRRQLPMADIVRFGLVAVAAFVIVVGLTLYFRGLPDGDDAVETAPEVTQPAEDAAPTPAARPAKKKPKTKARTSDEPIDIFDDVSDDTPTKPIIIEGGQ